jgi:hypothetical protein
MVKHVVMWRIKDLDEGYDTKSAAWKMKEKLESMIGKIPELKSLQVGINENQSPSAYHICLITEHQSWDDLKAYQENPFHKEVGAFVTEISKERAVVDFEFK